MTNTNSSFTKLNSGEWGLRVIGSAHEGDYVEIIKRNGEKMMKQIGRVLWADGEGKDRVSLCTVAKGSYTIV